MPKREQRFSQDIESGRDISDMSKNFGAVPLFISSAHKQYILNRLCTTALL
jgi:hypothetical protein